MNKAEIFDEMQINNRNKFGLQAFIINIILIFINSLIKMNYGVWATPITEGTCLLIIPLFYFNSRCIIKDSYFSNNKKIKIMLMMDFFVTSIILTTYLISNNSPLILHNNVLSDSFSILCWDIFSILSGIIYCIKSYSDSKHSE